MLTPEQMQALKKYKHTLNQYNSGQITFEEYVQQTTPQWEQIRILFNFPKK
jgi:hypothetical protein